MTDDEKRDVALAVIRRLLDSTRHRDVYDIAPYSATSEDIEDILSLISKVRASL